MRALRGAIALVLALALSAPVLAADFQVGLDAYDHGDYATALKEWRPLAEQGDAGAQFNLGLLYDTGRGVPQNYAEAAKWYRLAADGGYDKAQFNLALMYNNGTGVTQDYAEAMKWFRLAAEQGHRGAMKTLSFLYWGGEGVARDYVEAYMWYSLAATLGNEPTRAARDVIARAMTPAQIAEAERLAREWREGLGE